MSRFERLKPGQRGCLTIGGVVTILGIGAAVYLGGSDNSAENVDETQDPFFTNGIPGNGEVVPTPTTDSIPSGPAETQGRLELDGRCAVINNADNPDKNFDPSKPHIPNVFRAVREAGGDFNDTISVSRNGTPMIAEQQGWSGLDRVENGDVVCVTRENPPDTNPESSLDTGGVVFDSNRQQEVWQKARAASRSSHQKSIRTSHVDANWGSRRF